MASIKTDRRHFLAVSAIAAAAGAGLVVTPAIAADPLLNAIDNHLSAIRERDSARSMSAPWPEQERLYKRESRAAEVVVATAPSTMAGLKALEDHLFPIDAPSRYECMRFIRNRWLVDQPDGRMSEEDIAYCRAADGMENVRRFYERPLADFIAERQAQIELAA
jgi:hypothetical protein